MRGNLTLQIVDDLEQQLRTAPDMCDSAALDISRYLPNQPIFLQVRLARLQKQHQLQTLGRKRELHGRQFEVNTIRALRQVGRNTPPGNSPAKSDAAFSREKAENASEMAENRPPSGQNFNFTDLQLLQLVQNTDADVSKTYRLKDNLGLQIFNTPSKGKSKTYPTSSDDVFAEGKGEHGGFLNEATPTAHAGDLEALGTIRRLQKRVAVLETENRTLSQENAAVKEEMEATVKNAQLEEYSLKKSIQQLSEQLKLQNQSLATAEGLEAKSRHLEATCMLLNAQLSALRTKLARKEGQVASLRATLKARDSSPPRPQITARNLPQRRQTDRNAMFFALGLVIMGISGILHYLCQIAREREM